LSQVTFGIVFFIALAAVSLYWSFAEADGGNQIFLFLWIVAGLLITDSRLLASCHGDRARP
jgi:hypothetical protein